MPFIKVKDLDFYYEQTDFTLPWNAEPEKVLLLHGLHGSLKYWNHFQVGSLSSNFNVLTIDQRGHGKSYKPSFGYTIENMADDVEQILAKLDFHPAHIVGASMGGMVALQLALAAPRYVKSLVLVDSFPFSPDPLKSGIEAWTEQVKQKGYAEVMRTFNSDNSSLFSKEYMEKRPNFIDFDDQEVLRNLMPAEAFIGACEAIKAYDVRDQLSKIDVPTLIITSNEGLGFEVAKLMHEKMAKSEIWAPEGLGHLINIEEPELFNQKLIEFIRKAN